ncbi:L-asparaginase 2 [Agaricicola taiwanensis]|uniref:L-asparaginase 2 n=1 Tax=Agaricicola taiwanensis TaxID=591372 RepID=A0A8J2YGW0_9RHOB|nr:asparaginase [Agaricicola taiwanensis]GGE38209.1 L-asparaginase 2 [Agaricicola taiwanensis]
MSTTKPRIAIIGTGGTISSLGTHSLEVLDYPEVSRKMEPDEAIERVPEAAQFADLTPLPFRAVGSTKIGPQDWIELANLIKTNAAEMDGFVILHGTATLEETAYFLHLVLKVDTPVVVVGAQRPASALSTDVGMNVVSAVRTACSEDARGKGVLVVLNDEIHSARDATKTSTYRLQTFQSRDFGLLGHVDGDGVYWYRQPLRAHTHASAFDIKDITSLPRVDIVYSYAGCDGVAVDAFVAAGAKGLVSAGMAPGLTSPVERIAFEQAAKSGVVVVQSNRAGSGRVARRTYLKDKAMVGADNLNPQKARVLLSLALTKTNDPDEIQRLFQTH